MADKKTAEKATKNLKCKVLKEFATGKLIRRPGQLIFLKKAEAMKFNDAGLIEILETSKV